MPSKEAIIAIARARARAQQNQPTGDVVTPGNIDLSARPVVHNNDGSVSTVRSIGVNIDGKEVLLPTVSDDGRLLSDDEAIKEYRRTGKHLGVYRTAQASDQAGQRIHEEQMQHPPRVTKDTFESNTPLDTAGDALRGVGTGATMGFDDEIAGAASAAKNLITGHGWTGYTQARDEYRDKKKLAELRSPWANRLGQAGGAIGATLLTAGAAPEAAGAAGAGRLAQGTIARLAAEGAAAGVGSNDTQRGELASAEDNAIAAGEGAAAGVVGGKVLGGAARGAGRFLSGAGAKLARTAADRARVAQGNLNWAAVENEPGGVSRLAATMRKYGVGNGLPGASRVYEQASEAVDKAAAGRAAIAKEASGQPVRGSLIASKLRERARDPGALPPESKAYRGVASDLEDQAKAYAGPNGNRELSFDYANKQRAQYASRDANFGSDSPVNQGREQVHAALNAGLEDAANRARPGAGGEFRELGQDMHGLIMTKEGAAARLGGEAKGGPGLGAEMALGNVARGGNPLPGAGAVIARKAGLARYQALRARLAEGSATFQSALERLDHPLPKLLAKHAAGIGQSSGRMAAAATQEGIQRVSSADEQDRAKEHFLESQTNPSYNQAAFGADEAGQ